MKIGGFSGWDSIIKVEVSLKSFRESLSHETEKRKYKFRFEARSMETLSLWSFCNLAILVQLQKFHYLKIWKKCSVSRVISFYRRVKEGGRGVNYSINCQSILRVGFGLFNSFHRLCFTLLLKTITKTVVRQENEKLGMYLFCLLNQQINPK